MTVPHNEMERILLLEYKDKLREEKLERIDRKLDDLLALRQKGIGAFWVASSLLGTGIVGALSLVIDWFKGS